MSEEESMPAKGWFTNPARIVLLTSGLTFLATMVGNYAARSRETKAQVKLRDLSDERQVYAQITGQKAVLLQLESDMAATSDALVWYEASSAGASGASLALKGKELAKVLSGLSAKVMEDSFQKERLLEHLQDQSLTITQQFSALGEARLLFPEDEHLDLLIRRIEQLPDYDYHGPNMREMLEQPDINAFLTARKKLADERIKQQFGQPIEDVLVYLKHRIDQNS